MPPVRRGTDTGTKAGGDCAEAGQAVAEEAREGGVTRISQARARELGLLPKKKKLITLPKPTQAKWDAEVTPEETRITIPGELPSLNQWSRQHWAKRKEKLDNLTGCMRLLALAFKIPRYERPQVRVVYYFRVKRRRDKDNYAPKFILDALRYAGIIAEDNADVLELLPVEFEVDAVSPRVEVWIKEREL